MRPGGRSRACYHRCVTDQELKWWHVRWRLAGRSIYRLSILPGKIIGFVCLVAAIGYDVVYLISPWLASHTLSRLDPRLSIVPSDLPTKDSAPLLNASIDAEGFTFRLPDKVPKTARGNSTSFVRLSNGGFIWSRNFSRDPGVIESMFDEKNPQMKLGTEVLRSRFNLMQAAMRVTPEQVKWWRLRNLANERAEKLLLTKFTVLSLWPSPHSAKDRSIYTVASGPFRGFQVGNPDVVPYEAHVDVFDAADQHVAFDVNGPEGHGQVLTQKEINAMIASIQPAPVR